MRVDLHCHLLPGIDDGAKDTDQALAMVRLALADDITHIVCTPHHLNGVYRNDADAIRAHCLALQAAIDQAGLALTLYPGAENHLVPELPQALAQGQALTLADRGRHVLVELPVMSIPLGTDQVLKSILSQGLTPIIVHPERNEALRRHPETLSQWCQWGCLGQVTAQSLTGQFGPQVQQSARTMIELGSIHCMASDAHRDRRRIPKLSEGHQALVSWYGQAVADLLTDEIPHKLLRGQSIDHEVVAEALLDGQAPTQSGRAKGRTQRSKLDSGSGWRAWLGWPRRK